MANGRQRELEDTSDDGCLVGPSTWVYKKRWYMLFEFCFACVLQGCVWNAWGPIAQSSKDVFDWTDANIALLPSWGNIMNCVTIVPVTWLMDVKGMRLSMIVCCIFLVMGTGVRCLPVDTSVASWLINFGQILNGIAGTFTFSGPTLMSVTWFPPEQRATATAICALSCYLGIALAFIIGPQVVPEPTNFGNQSSVNVSFVGNQTDELNLTVAMDTESLRASINTLMYAEFGAACLLFLLILVSFMDRPKLPPSRAQTTARTDYRQGLSQLMRMPAYWYISLGFSIPTGVYQAWGTVLDVNLNTIDFSQNEAGWLGFWTIIAGCVSGIIISRLADIFKRNLKKMLVIALLIGVVAMAFFTVVCLDYIPSLPYKTVWIYVGCVIGGICLNGAIPIFYESGCETTYPIAEGITTGFMTFLQNFVGAVFLGLLQIPNIGVTWMNWFLVGSIVSALPLMVVYKQIYHKLDAERQEVVYVRNPVGPEEL